MADISAKMVKDLREKTGAGMMDCKKALTASGGDIDGAVEQLRKSGLAKAAKKAGRETTEGKIESLVSADAAVMVEVLCETDFVAKNDSFVDFCRDVAADIAANVADTGDVSAAVAVRNKVKIGELVAKVGENIQIRRAVRWAPEGECGTYIHMGGKIGVVVDVIGGKDAEYLSSLCMHIAAFNPAFLSPDQVPADVVEKEKEIAAAQPELKNKPPEILEKILVGKINKWYSENCLLKQIWIRDDKIRVEKVKPGAKIRRYLRWQVGEEI